MATIQSLLIQILYTSNTGFTNSETTQIRSSKLKGDGKELQKADTVTEATVNNVFNPMNTGGERLPRVRPLPGAGHKDEQGNKAAQRMKFQGEDRAWEEG